MCYGKYSLVSKNIIINRDSSFNPKFSHLFTLWSKILITRLVDKKKIMVE
jgi:hypothetical protein